MDSFCEHLIKRKKKLSEKIIIGLLFLVGALFTVFVFLCLLPWTFYAFQPLASFVLPLLVVVWWGLLILIKKYNIEFEYAITGSEIDIDKIINKKKRKRIVSTSIRSFEIVAPLNSSKYNENYKSLIHTDCSSLSVNANTYFAAYFVDGQKKCLLFDPTEKMLNMIKRYCPDKFYTE